MKLLERLKRSGRNDMKRPIKVVIDTNIWISFLIGKTLAGLTEAIIKNNVIILF